MATKTKKKVVDIEEVKQDIALVDEADKEETDVTKSEGDLCTTSNTELSTENSEVECKTCKKGKIKNFLKKNWKKILTGGIAIGIGAGAYFIGKKTSELSDDDIHNIEQEGIKDYWRRINQLFKDDPDQAYAISVTDPEANKIDWLEVTPVDSIPEWIDKDKNMAAEF